jgi:hypothetical protein
VSRPLTVLVQAGAPIQCPACQRTLSGVVRVLPGSRGGLVLPLRCPRSACRAHLELVVAVAASPRAAVHVAETG